MRKQGLLNYKLKVQDPNQEQSTHVDPAKLKQIIFNGKPKRMYKANRNKKISFQDPKRVHTCLREFNDQSANKVFQGILNQIQEMENEKSDPKKAGFRRNTTAIGKSGRGDMNDLTAAGGRKHDDGVGFGQTGLESMDLEMASAEEIIANVERMIKQEETKNNALKKDKKAGEKTLDLDVGLASQPTPAQTNAAKGGVAKADTSMTSGGSTTEGTEHDNEDLFSMLDEDITIMRRKTMAIKSDNVQTAIMQNVSAITESL
jgi:hypothetical protein